MLNYCEFLSEHLCLVLLSICEFNHMFGSFLGSLHPVFHLLSSLARRLQTPVLVATVANKYG